MAVLRAVLFGDLPEHTTAAALHALRGGAEWFTLSLFAYFAVVAMVHIDWTSLARYIFLSHITWTPDYLTAVVAVFGTTISPYLFFWQSEEEVEDMRAHPRRLDLLQAPGQGSKALPH